MSNKLENKLDILIESQNNILKRLDNMENKLKDIEKDSNKMSSHIDFVECVYDKIKYPFHYLMNVVSKYPYMIKNSNHPQIT
jgi:hypothetical protein